MKRYVLASLLILAVAPYALAQDSSEPDFRPSYGVREDGSQIIYHASGENEIRQPDGATVRTRKGKVTELKPPYDCEPLNQSKITTETTPAYDREDDACYLYDIQYISYSCKTREGEVEQFRRRYIISFKKRNPAVPCDAPTYTQARERAKTQYGEEDWPPPPVTAEDEPKPPKDGPGLPLPARDFKLPVLPPCFESVEARWEYADSLYEMFLGQVNAISFAADQTARDRAKVNVEALASLRAKALLVDICPPKTSAGLAPPPSPGTDTAPLRPLPPKPAPRPGAAAPAKLRTGFLTEDEAKEREEQLKQDPDWPRRRAAIEKMIRERNKKGEAWREQDWFDWLLEQTGKLPSDGCSDAQLACGVNPNAVSDTQLRALVGEPQVRARIEDLLNDPYTAGRPGRNQDNRIPSARIPNPSEIPGYDDRLGYPGGTNPAYPQPAPRDQPPYDVPRTLPGMPPIPNGGPSRFLIMAARPMAMKRMLLAAGCAASLAMAAGIVLAKENPPAGAGAKSSAETAPKPEATPAKKTPEQEAHERTAAMAKNAVGFGRKATAALCDDKKKANPETIKKFSAELLRGLRNAASIEADLSPEVKKASADYDAARMAAAGQPDTSEAGMKAQAARDKFGRVRNDKIGSLMEDASKEAAEALDAEACPPKPRTAEQPPAKPAPEKKIVPKAEAPQGGTGRPLTAEEQAQVDRPYLWENLGGVSEYEVQLRGTYRDTADEYREAIESWGDKDPRTIKAKKAFEAANGDLDKFLTEKEAANKTAEGATPVPPPKEKPAKPPARKTEDDPSLHEEIGALPKCAPGRAQSCSLPGQRYDASAKDPRDDSDPNLFTGLDRDIVDKQKANDAPVACFGDPACLREEALHGGASNALPGVIPNAQPPSRRNAVPGYTGASPYLGSKP